METLYNYRAFDCPRRGIFSVMKNPNQYTLPGGWLHEDVEYTIIGETDDSYVTKIINSGHGEWVGDIVVEKKYRLPIGLHKTRFIQWINGDA